MVRRVLLLCLLPLLDQMSAHKYYGEKCIPDSEILLPDGRCFCNTRGFIELCVGLFEREDMVMRSESGKKQIGRIVGGRSVPISLHPYVVAFEKNGLLWCGATIISNDWAITAAHCFDRVLDNFKCAAQVTCGDFIQTLKKEKQKNPYKLGMWKGNSDAWLKKIRAGTSKLEKEGDLFDVVQVFTHEDYNEQLKNHAYDLAVVRVDKPFRDVNKNLITVNLPDADYEMPVGTMVTVMGWGATKENGKVASDLQEIQVPIVARATCRYVYGRIITSHMICAGYPEGRMDACQADSGGPMVINHTLVGLVAFGDGCARPDRPGVYISVASFRDWIMLKVGV